MWLLHYVYDDEAGELYKERQIIRKSKEYSIGRSVKCTCTIQNDKSVSRVHLVLKPDGSDLILTNKGKLTKLNDQLVPLEENIVLHKQNMLLSIGGAPINVHISYMYEEWKIPHKMDLNDEKLLVSDFDVKLSDSFSKKTTLQIFSDNTSYSGCLFALLKGVPVVSTTFLGQIGQLLESGDHVDFLPVYQGLIKQNRLFPEYMYEANVLKNMTFLVLEQKVYDTLRYTIAVGGGEIKLFNNASQVDEFLSSNSGPVCVLSSNSFHQPNSSANFSEELDPSIRDVLLRHKLKILNINQFTYMLLNNKIKDLRKRKIASTSEPSSTLQKHTEITPEKPTKQKRSKPQIQSFDSLSYFGGGDPAVKSESIHEQSIPLSSKKEANINAGNQDSLSVNATEDERTSLTDCQTTPAEMVAEVPSVSSGFAEPGEPTNSPLNQNIISTGSKKRKRPTVHQLENFMMRGLSQNTGDSEVERRSETVNGAKPNDVLPEAGSNTSSRLNPVSNGVKAARTTNLPSSSINDTSPQKINSDEGTTCRSSTREEERVPKEATLARDITPRESTQHAKGLPNSNSRPQSTAQLQTELPIKNSSNIVNAIAETKQIEVQRFKEGMVEVHESELTKSALNDFKDVVKVNTVKIKPRVFPSMTVIGHSRIGASRKNFKRFKKNWPLYHNFSTDLPCESFASEKNREYIKLRTYDNGHRSKSNLKGKIENVPADRLEDRGAHSRDRSVGTEDVEAESGFRFTNREGSVSSTSLFVADDDDENELSLQSSKFSNSTRHTGQLLDRLSFSGTQSNKSPSADNLRPSSASNYLEEDDDDDDDDTPRFNFRSRRHV